MNAPPINSELLDLLDAICNDALTGDGRQRLAAILAEDAEARRIYFDYIEMHVQLRRWQKAETGAAETPRRADSPPPHDDPHPQPIILDLSSPSNASTPFVGGFAFSYMVASVFMCLLLLGFWAYKLPSDRDSSIASSDNSRRSTTSGEESIHDRPAPVFVGRVTGIAGAKWSDEPDYIAPIGYRVALGRTYKLKSGLMEITYDSGAKVILEGPCSYEVDSTAGGYLALGKLTAKVEAGGEGREAGEVVSGQWSVTSMKEEGGRRKEEGDRPNAASLATSHQPLATNPSPLFSVRTPTAVVTDLGTEFGVEFAENGDTTSHVFRGSVRMQIVGNDKHIVLHENESARIALDDSGKPSIAALGALHSPRFVLEMPASKSAAAAKAYAELVLSLEPAAYYRMDCPQDKTSLVVHDSAPGQHHGELRLGDAFGGSPYRGGSLGESLWFRGPDVKDYVIVPDYPKTTNGQLTISAWVMAVSRPAWAMIASNWANLWRPGDKAPGQFHFGLCRAAGDLSARVTQRNGTRLDIREGGDRPLPLFVWQHVALVSDGNSLRLYRNGVEVAVEPCDGILAEPPVASLSIGCTLNETGSAARDDAHPRSIFWQGRIDELAIFNRALSAKDIEQLASSKTFNQEEDEQMNQ